MKNKHLPLACKIVGRIQESPSIFTLNLEIINKGKREGYQFLPGQFNMLHLMGAGEIPISIVSDPNDPHIIKHTIRNVGRITKALSEKKVGDYLGIRGPYGSNWPIKLCNSKKDVVIVTGGLGCAPVVSVIHYLLKRPELFARLVIIQGVKHSDDLIWKEQYQQWQQLKNVEVLLAADETDEHWLWYQGQVPSLLSKATFNKESCLVMMCGPEIMMHYSALELTRLGVSREQIWLSLERNMQCALGQCGHCQMGQYFICKDGAIFNYPQVAKLMEARL